MWPRATDMLVMCVCAGTQRAVASRELESMQGIQNRKKSFAHQAFNRCITIISSLN